MADKKISALTGASTPLGGTEVLPIVQSGSTVKVSVADLTAGRSVATGPLTSTHTSGAGVTVTRGTKSLELSGNYAGGDVFSAITATAGMDIALLSGGSEILRAVNTGNVNINNGNLVFSTSGKGIDFSATPGTGTSELLADYEEGTFTPTWTPATGSGATVNNASGWYTKVGNRVTVDVYISTNGHGTSAGAVTIGGLPFTSTANSNQLGGFYLAQAANSGLGIGQMVAGRILYNTTTFSPIAWGAAGGGTGTMTAAEWGVSGLYRFTGSYQTA